MHNCQTFVCFLSLLPICRILSVNSDIRVIRSTLCVCMCLVAADVLDKQGGRDNSFLHSAPSIKLITYSCFRKQKVVFFRSILLYYNVIFFNFEGFMESRHPLSRDITE